MEDSILSVVYQTAKGLNDNKIMDNITMRKIEALYLPEIEEYTPEEIKKIRLKNKTSQSIFAHYLNISSSTVQKWERGQKKPSGSALKLLNIIDKKGLEILV
mgnify:CR=1 FL=1